MQLTGLATSSQPAASVPIAPFLNLHQAFAGFVAVGVAPVPVVSSAGRFIDLADQPQQDVERVRAEIAERAAAGDLRVGHPAPFGVEPSAQRTAVAVAAAHAGDLAEVAFVDLLA